jgi:hypothetical protein
MYVLLALRLCFAAVARAGQERNVGTLPAFGQRVPRLQLVGFAAEFRGDFGGEFVTGREEDFGAETLEERTPGFVAAERGSQ